MTRDITIYLCDILTNETVWEAVKNEIPPIEPPISSLLKDLKNTK